MLSTVPDIILWAIPLFVITMVLEAVESYRDGEPAYRDTRDTAASLSMGLGNVIITVFWKGAAFAGYLLVWDNLRLFDVGWAWWAWVAVLFADDLAYYWFHRLHHEVRLFWASHVVHHSSEKYNLGTALRQTWTPMSGFLFWVPLAFIGFHPVMILTMQAISLVYQYWIHTERIDRMWAPIELVMNTPSHHRVHHGSNPQYIDKNYGGILIVWDRLFGTFEAEGERVRYGLTKNLDTYNPVKIAFHEYLDIARDATRPGLTVGDRLGFVFRGPGWAYGKHAELGLAPRWTKPQAAPLAPTPAAPAPADA